MEEKVIRAFIVLIIILLAFTSAIAQSIEENGQKVIYVRGDNNYPPFEFINDAGKPDGYNVDLMNAVTSAMGIEAEIALGPWIEVRQQIESGDIDILLGMYNTPERSRTVDFSVPTIVVSYALYVREDSPVHRIDDLKNRTVILHEGDLGHDYVVENSITRNFIVKQNWADVLLSLSRGQGDAAIVSRLQGNRFIAEQNLSNLKATGQPIMQRNYGMAVTKGNSSLLAILNEGLSIIKTSGEYDQIYHKWFGAFDRDYELSQTMLETIMRIAPAGIGLVQDRVIQSANDYVLELTGYQENELIGQSARMLYPSQEDSDYVGTEKYRQIAEKGTGTVETRWLRKDGDIRHVILSSTPLDLSNLSKGVVFTVQDITYRIRAEQELMEQQLFQRALLQAIPVAVFYKDHEGLYIGCNTHFTDIMGVTSEEIKAKSVFELWPGEMAAQYHQADIELMNNPVHQIYESEIQDKHGVMRPVIFGKQVFYDADGEVAGLVGAFVDISEQRALQENIIQRTRLFLISAAIFCVILILLIIRLFNSLQRQRTTAAELQGANLVVENSKVIVIRWKHAENWPVIMVSQNISQFGYSHEELISGNITHADMVHPDDLGRMNNEIEHHMANRNDRYRQEYRILTKDAQVRWIDDRTTVIRDSNGDVIEYQGILLDISERKLAEEKILQLNQQLEQKVQERTEELRVAFEELKATNMNLEHTIQNLNEARNQLLQSEKLSALGQLTAGLAHELNTPLGAILSANRAMHDFFHSELPRIPAVLESLNEQQIHWFQTLLLENLYLAIDIETIHGRKECKALKAILEDTDIEASPALIDLLLDLQMQNHVTEHLDLLKDPRSADILTGVAQIVSVKRSGEIISVAAEKAAHVVRALQSYLHHESPENISPVDLHSELETALTLHHNKMKYGVSLKKSFNSSGYVLGEKNSLSQVWMNLLNNALQAINYKGNIEIRTEDEENMIRISFIDSGPGIPEKVKDRIFEPFFTTKRHGEGMGLGLEICNAIIAKFGGTIDFDSIPGKTNFTVKLIAADRQQSV